MDASAYWVGVTIGEGAFGRVVHAKHKATGKDVAIKVVEKVNLQKEPLHMQAILNEKRVLSRWQSNLVVQLYAAFHDEECLYLVMPCLKGGDLSHLIRAGRRSRAWSGDSVSYYSLQILAALEFIHSERILHVDLKPDNILLSGSGRIQLADFGSAVSISTTKTKRTILRPLGTVDYSCPELLRNSPDPTIGVDLWSFGCVLYAMFEGQSPFHDKSDALAVQRIVSYARKETPLQMFAGDDAWRELISRLLRGDPVQRIGVSDYRDTGTFSYESIRSCAVWTTGGEHMPFVAPVPDWWEKAQETPLKDGGAGWSAFLL